jgi:uncharacterized protein with FMN-binding domain
MNTTKKIILGVVLVAAIIGYAIYQKLGTSSATAAIDTQTTATTTPASGGNPSTANSGMYKDGTYTGSVANAIYGNIQVAATISGGKITDVTFLQYPNGAGHTIQLSQQVMPVLKSEAIEIQSAKVNVVSGATQDSQAFQQSLASALAMAQN